jgi:antitoxin MazE
MKVPIVRIGNSKGIRLSATWIRKYNLTDEVELVFEPEAIIIKPIAKPRQHWDEAFADMRKRKDDNLLIDSVLDKSDWE